MLQGKVGFGVSNKRGCPEYENGVVQFKNESILVDDARISQHFQIYAKHLQVRCGTSQHKVSECNWFFSGLQWFTFNQWTCARIWRPEIHQWKFVHNTSWTGDETNGVVPMQWQVKSFLNKSSIKEVFCRLFYNVLQLEVISS